MRRQGQPSRIPFLLRAPRSRSNGKRSRLSKLFSWLVAVIATLGLVLVVTHLLVLAGIQNQRWLHQSDDSLQKVVVQIVSDEVKEMDEFDDNLRHGDTSSKDSEGSEHFGHLPDESASLWTRLELKFCGRLFGNGFREMSTSCEPEILCLKNEASLSTLCSIRDLRIRKGNIQVAKGGEPIEKVWGRGEDEEFCNYSENAFATRCGTSIANLNREAYPYHLYDILSAMGTLNDKDLKTCAKRRHRPALLITRYEYANLYHTMTDWYNAYQTMRMYELSEPDLIFLDGHSAGHLDEVWEVLFGQKPRYVSSLEQDECFEIAILVPPGYRSALSIQTMKQHVLDCRAMRWVSDFSQVMLNRFKIIEESAGDDKPYVLLILRKDYKAHPRIGSSKASRKISNEDRLVKDLKNKLPGVRIFNVSLESLSFSEQLRAVRGAQIVVGVHGAGLSHVLFQRPETALVELSPPSYGARNHFKFFAAFAGIEYFRMQIGQETSPGSGHVVDADELANVIRRIFSR